jgi:hypothetical protein
MIDLGYYQPKNVDSNKQEALLSQIWNTLCQARNTIMSKNLKTFLIAMEGACFPFMT